MHILNSNTYYTKRTACIKKRWFIVMVGLGILVDRLRWLGAVLVCQHLKSGQFESIRSEQRQWDHQEAIHSANHHVEIFNLIQWVALLSQAENKTKDSLRICRDISYEHEDVQRLTRSMGSYFAWMCRPWAGWPMERGGMKGKFEFQMVLIQRKVQHFPSLSENQKSGN